jgi:uncharacterized protein
VFGGAADGLGVIDLFTALALALVIEGAAYALFPDGMRTMMMQMLSQPSGTLRTAGLVAVAIGVGAVWLLRG